MPAVPLAKIEPDAKALSEGKSHDLALRVTALGKYREARAKGPVSMQDGRQVQLTMVGFRETKRHSSDTRLLDLLSNIREPLEKAVYITSEAPDPTKKAKPTTRAFHYYAAKLSDSGRDLYARLVIRENTNEEIYYDADLSSIEEVTARDLAATPPNAGADVLGGDSKAALGDHAHSLRQLLDSVNDKFAQAEHPASAETPTAASEADKTYTTFSLTGIPQKVEHEIEARTERIHANKLSAPSPLTQQDLYAEAHREARIAKDSSVPPKPHKDKQGLLSRALGTVSETLHRLHPDVARKLRRMEFYIAQLNTPLAKDKNNDPYRQHILARLRRLEQGSQTLNQPQPSLKDNSSPDSNDQYRTLNEPTQAELDADPHGIALLSKDQLQAELQRLQQAPLAQSHLANVQPFLDAYSTLPRDLRKQLDLALKNSDTRLRDTILRVLQMQDAYAPVQQTLETLHKQLTDAGFQLGYLPNYFVRKVSDTDGLFALLEQRGETLDDSSTPSQPESGVLIIDGEQHPKPSFFYKRARSHVDPEMNAFYADSAEALNSYIEEATQLLAAKQFFGKHAVLVKDAPSPRIDYEASVDNLLAELKDKSDATAHAAQDGQPTTHDTNEPGSAPLSDQDLELIRGNLLARFLYKPSGTTTRFLRETSILTTLAHFGPVITQLEDLALAAYAATAPDAATAASKALFGKSDITAEMLGLDSNSQTGLYDPGPLHKAITWAFKLTGFEHMDRVGKEAIMNAKISQLRRQAQLGRFDPNSQRLLDASFSPEERAKVIEDLKAGRLNEDVLFAAYSVLANYQPINRSEYPRSYLQSPNGRLFYTLKTFTIRALNTIRRESFDLIHRGVKAGDYKLVTQGLKNLVRLLFFMWLGGLTASYLKDWLYGRPTKFSDNAIDSLWRIGNMSRWYAWQYRGFIDDVKDGEPTDATIKASQALWGFVGLPYPLPFETWKDIKNANAPKRRKDGQLRVRKGSEAIKVVPIVGQPYYWWFGEGARKTAVKRANKGTREHHP